MTDNSKGNIVSLAKAGIERPRRRDVLVGALAATGDRAQARSPGASNLIQAIARSSLRELDVSFHDDEQILIANQRHAEKLHFTWTLLDDIRRLQMTIENWSAKLTPGEALPFRYLVWASQYDGIFNLGGDLDQFSDMIARRDRAGLARYARLCVDVCHDNAVNMGLPIVTMALVQGDALGGGFESALSSDIIVAEKRSRFGLPEILFGLFPGMGAYSFLARRVGAKLAEQMIFSGKIYTADELHALGVVDILCDDGMGEVALLEYVMSTRRHFPAHRSIYRVRRHFHPINYREMSDIADIWVETALEISDADLRKMKRLAGAQTRRRKQAPAEGAADPGVIA